MAVETFRATAIVEARVLRWSPEDTVSSAELLAMLHTLDS